MGLSWYELALKNLSIYMDISAHSMRLVGLKVSLIKSAVLEYEKSLALFYGIFSLAYKDAHSAISFLHDWTNDFWWGILKFKLKVADILDRMDHFEVDSSFATLSMIISRILRQIWLNLKPKILNNLLSKWSNFEFLVWLLWAFAVSH